MAPPIISAQLQLSAFVPRDFLEGVAGSTGWVGPGDWPGDVPQESMLRYLSNPAFIGLFLPQRCGVLGVEIELGR
jgi:hypothetical protein